MNIEKICKKVGQVEDIGQVEEVAGLHIMISEDKHYAAHTQSI